MVLKSIILWQVLCIALYSQNPNTTFKIRFWVFPHGLWRASSSKHRVIPSKFMKRGWKYSLKQQEGGEGTPSKDSRLGALKNVWYNWAHSAINVIAMLYLTNVNFCACLSLRCILNCGQSTEDWKTIPTFSSWCTVQGIRGWTHPLIPNLEGRLHTRDKLHQR